MTDSFADAPTPGAPTSGDGSRSSDSGLVALQEVVAILMERVTALEKTPAIATSAPAGFAEWVAWLVDVYVLEVVIPTDWAAMPSVRAELAALHHAHEAAYGPKGGPWDPLTWHDQLARALNRIDPGHRHGYVQRTEDRHHHQ